MALIAPQAPAVHAAILALILLALPQGGVHTSPSVRLAECAALAGGLLLGSQVRKVRR